MNAAILVAEDEAVVACDLQSQIENLGYRVGAVAASGEEALDLVRLYRPDLILMDTSRGVEDVGETLRGGRRAPVVLLTALSRTGPRYHRQTEQPDSFTVMPCPLRDFLRYDEWSSPRTDDGATEAAAPEVEVGEVRFRQLLDSRFLGFCVTDFNEAVFDASDTLLSFLGQDRAALDRGPIPWADVAGADAVSGLRSIVGRLASGEDVAPLEIDLRDAAGATIPVLVSPMALQGHTDRVLAIFSDLRHRKRAEQEREVRLRQQSTLARLGQVAATSADRATLFETAACLVAASFQADACAIVEATSEPEGFAVRATALVGGITAGFIQVGDAGCRALFGQVILLGTSLVSEDLRSEARFKDAQSLVLAGLLSATCASYPARGGLFGAIQLFSRRSHAFCEADVLVLEAFASSLAAGLDRLGVEAAIDRLTGDYEQLLAALGDAVLKVDQRGRICYASHGLCRVSGWTSDELIGEAPEVILPNLSAVFDVLRDGQPRVVHGQVRWRGEGARVPVECILSPVTERTRPIGVVASLRVFQGTGRARTVLRQADPDLRQIVQLSPLEQLAADAANDMDSVISVIDSGLRRLGGSGFATALGQSAMDRMNEAVQRGIDLIGRMRAFGRREATVERPVEVNAVVTYLEPSLRLVLGAGVEVEVQLDPQAHQVLADPRALEQLTLALAQDAKVAMPDGGLFKLQTSSASMRQLASIACDWAAVLISVRYRGRAREGAASFRAYWKRDEESALRFSALGDLVRRVRGTIELEKLPDEETSIKVFLPAYVGANQTGIARLHVAEGTNRKVLLLHSDSASRSLVRSILEQSGYTVLEARDESDALAISELHEGDIHLLLAETCIDGASGRQIAKRITASRPDVRVLLLGSYADYAICQEQDVGLDENVHVVEKPVTMDSLLTWVREILRTAD